MQDAGLINANTPDKINTPAAGTCHIYKNDGDERDGLFYAKLPDGTSVLVGGITPGGASSLSVSISTEDDVTFSADTVGGESPLTYEWSNNYSPVDAAPAAETFDGATDGQTADVAATSDTMGLITVKVTDANGLIAYATRLYNNVS